MSPQLADGDAILRALRAAYGELAAAERGNDLRAVARALAEIAWIEMIARDWMRGTRWAATWEVWMRRDVEVAGALAGLVQAMCPRREPRALPPPGPIWD